MRIRTLLIATAGVAALSLAACNRPADEDATTEDEAAMSAEEAGTDASGTAADTSGGGAMSASGGSTSGGSMSGSSTSSGTAGETTGSMNSGSTAMTGQVDSSIPADAPSRNTRETAGAAGAPNQGQTVPYAYSPTNPTVAAKE